MQYFNPRSPRGERRFRRKSLSSLRDFNPRSPRGERRLWNTPLTEYEQISIHAPLAGSDPHRLIHCPATPYFNPRSPRGERHRIIRRIRYMYDFNPLSPRGERPEQTFWQQRSMRFQSTLPSRGATILLKIQSSPIKISIHAPLAGSDGIYLWRGACTDRFQSTLPSRGATQ